MGQQPNGIWEILRLLKQLGIDPRLMADAMNKQAMAPSHESTLQPPPPMPYGGIAPEFAQTPFNIQDMPSIPGTIIGEYRPQEGNIMISRNEMNKRSDTLPHEIGHSIWVNDLTDSERKGWEIIHGQNNAPKDFRKVSSRFFKTYATDPAHSFAAMYGLFGAQPKRLKAENPQIYDFLKATTHGREYEEDK